MPYSPPTLAELRTTVARSLRDVNGDVFTDADLNDFIYEAIADLSAYRPVPSIEHWEWGEEAIVGNQPMFVDLTYIWHVEVFIANQAQFMIPPNEQGYHYRNGWEMFGVDERLRLSAYWYAVLDQMFYAGLSPDIVMYGYREHFQPGADDDVLDLQSMTDELCVRLYARMAGFNRLNHDRGLYQQWLAATNNTDVSPTQIQGMLAQADDTYTRQRRRATLIRRVPGYNFQYVD
jgi:hypothetical protein